MVIRIIRITQEKLEFMDRFLFGEEDNRKKLFSTIMGTLEASAISTKPLRYTTLERLELTASLRSRMRDFAACLTSRKNNRVPTKANL